MQTAYIAVFLVIPGIGLADTVLAKETLRAKKPIAADSVHVASMDTPGAAETLQHVIGFEPKTAIYAGRPVLHSNLQRPAIIERNQVVSASYSVGLLTINTEVKALERGSVGDAIGAINLSSRQKMYGVVTKSGTLQVETRSK